MIALGNRIIIEKISVYLMLKNKILIMYLYVGKIHFSMPIYYTFLRFSYFYYCLYIFKDS